MARKVLIIANTARFVSLFELHNIRILQGMGYEVHCFCYFENEHNEKQGTVRKLAETGVVLHEADSFRSPFRLKNIKVYQQLKRLMRKERFDLIDCHTPMGGVLARAAAAATKTGPVIYTAHGFHFYKGAPAINWIIYYPAEWFLSHITDVLITINHEDYARARALHAKRTVMITGVGLDTEKFESAKTNFEQKRKDFGIPSDSFLIMSVGELNENKNHRVIIRAIAGLKEIKPYYLICGEGPEKESLQKLAQRLNVENQVIFGGLRSDIHELLKIADCFAFPSKREGLGIAALEAMAAGLPIITSNSGGITEYSEDGKTGFVCRPDDVIGFAETIRKVAEDKVLAARMSAYNRQAAKKYDIRNVNRTMTEIYESVSHRKLWNVCGERERTE